MSLATRDLWDLIAGGSQVDPDGLASAITRQVESRDLDFRTRLLIRDGLNALQEYWGRARTDALISSSTCAVDIRESRSEDLGEPGFPSLCKRVMKPHRPLTIERFLRDVGRRRRRDEKLREAAERNWYVLYGEALAT